MKNWKTSSGGLLMMLGQVLASFNPKWGGALTGLGGLLVGIAAKDYNVTGGQP